MSITSTQAHLHKVTIDVAALDPAAALSVVVSDGSINRVSVTIDALVDRTAAELNEALITALPESMSPIAAADNSELVFFIVSTSSPLTAANENISVASIQKVSIASNLLAAGTAGLLLTRILG
jgi:hypothetical protein